MLAAHVAGIFFSFEPIISFTVLIYGVVADEPVVVSQTNFQINKPSLLDFSTDIIASMQEETIREQSVVPSEHYRT